MDREADMANVQFFQSILIGLIVATAFTGMVIGTLVAHALPSDSVQYAEYVPAWER